MPKNNILLSLRIPNETKDKLDALCDKLESQIGFRPTQAQTIEFALTHAMNLNCTLNDFAPKTKESRSNQSKPAQKTKSRPSVKIDWNDLPPDETDLHKLQLKGRYAQQITIETLEDESNHWNEVPYELLYEIYRNRLPDSEDPYKDTPLNLKQYIEQIKRGFQDYILKARYDAWLIFETQTDMTATITGEPPLAEKYQLENWLKNNQDFVKNFNGFSRRQRM